MKALFSIGPVCLVTLAVLGLLPAEALAQTGDAGQATPGLAERLWLLLGTFHPMIVHFPIALLLLAAVMEVARFKFKNISPDVVYYCVVVAAVGALISVTFGWSRATNLKEVDTLFFHRWLGITVTVMTVALAVVATVARRKPDVPVLRTIQAIGVVTAAGLVGLVGHLGGDLTYGEGHVQVAIAKAFDPETEKVAIDIPNILPIEIAPKSVVPVPPKGQDPVQPQSPLGGGDANAAAVAVTKVDFLTQVWPIFENQCVKCHGPQKAKGRLRMDSKGEALKGGKTGQLWVAGNSAESLILKRIRDPEGSMPPPEEGELVTPEQLELIKRWIDEGAEWPVLPEPAAAAADATN